MGQTKALMERIRETQDYLTAGRVMDIVRECLYAREGQTLTMEVINERARNIATAIQGELLEARKGQ